MQALVIDDSSAMRGIIGRLLAKLGFDVFEAAHGLEAMERLGEIGKVDVILVDWNMPVMDGYEFVRRVRADQSYDKIPLIMVTTESAMSQMAKALAAGANEYIMKPFDSDMILQKLDIVGLNR